MNRSLKIVPTSRHRTLSLVIRRFGHIAALTVALAVSAGAAFEDWVTVSYGGLVDQTIITHSHEPVKTVIANLAKSPEDTSLLGLVQPYLEPYSLLCHDVLLALRGPDTLPLVNITSHYPEHAEQPAWAALFRQGRYQLYYNRELIRVFAQGTDIGRAVKQHRSVIRLAIRDIMSDPAARIQTIEVYVFTNDYHTMQIRLNPNPKKYAAADFDLRPSKRSMNLSSLEQLLKRGVRLEATKLDPKGGVIFYGKEGASATMAGEPLSLADLAVIYRATFHAGYNAPYISLDTHEDNRYAKANFGGYLEDTRIGSVVLEADRLFKVLTTGVEPQGEQVVRDEIAGAVPGFLTQDERRLIQKDNANRVFIRYWFYPDSIGTVTDGVIGVVTTSQFQADVERMDAKVPVSESVRQTVQDLNRRYGDYEKAFTTYTELSTVGRMMALMNFLREIRADREVELEELLSVRLPAIETSDKVKKQFALTVVARPEPFTFTPDNVRTMTRVFPISHLLERFSAQTSDTAMLDSAHQYFMAMDLQQYATGQIAELMAEQKQLDTIVAGLNAELSALEQKIRKSSDTLDSYDKQAVLRHNRLVDGYNELVIKQQSAVEQHNTLNARLTAMNVHTQYVVSIGGGIELLPRAFRRPKRVNDSPKLAEVRSLLGQPKGGEKIVTNGDWVYSVDAEEGARTNALAFADWRLNPSTRSRFAYMSGTDSAIVNLSQNDRGWESSIAVNGETDLVKFLPQRNEIEISHSVVPWRGIGRHIPSENRFVFGQ